MLYLYDDARLYDTFDLYDSPLLMVAYATHDLYDDADLYDTLDYYDGPADETVITVTDSLTSSVSLTENDLPTTGHKL